MIQYYRLRTGRLAETTEKDIYQNKKVYFSVVSEKPVQCVKKKEKNMFKKFEMELAGRTLRVDVGRVAAQAMVQH